MSLTKSAAAALLGAVCLPALSAVPATYGSLANFDVVNNTGQATHGFEIELEGISSADVLDVFGLNRNFGTPSPGDVQRYGIPVVDTFAGGVRVAYRARWDGSNWSAATQPVGATLGFTPGDSCWAFGGIGYPNVPCDHFGVSTRGTPTRTTYKWLVDGGGGTLVPSTVGVAVPPVVFTPPSPVQPQVQVQIVAQPVIPQPPLPPTPDEQKAINQGNSYWVKIIQTQLAEPVEVHQLMGGRFDDDKKQFANAAVLALGEKAETEVEWQVLQVVNGGVLVDEVTKSIDLAGNPALAIRFEFYEYKGNFDGEGLVDPQTEDWREIVDPLTNKTVRVPADAATGAFLGQQIAGFNAQVAAIPEPGSWALMLGGLAALGGWLRSAPATTRRSLAQAKAPAGNAKAPAGNATAAACRDGG